MTLLTGASVKVYVEDSADTIWSMWFPPDQGVQFENAGSKSQVRNKVQDDIKHVLPLSAGDLRRYLAEAVRENLPPDLQTIAGRWRR
jgi:hypothetical protein